MVGILSRVSAAAALGLCSFATSGCGALAQAVAPSSDQNPQERLIAKLSPNDLTPQLTKTLAEVATPIRLDASANETLGDVVKKLCGRDDTEYLAYLKANPKSLGIPSEQVSKDYKFHEVRKLELPFCVRFGEDDNQKAIENAEFWKSIMVSKQRDPSGWDLQVKPTYTGGAPDIVGGYVTSFDMSAAKDKWSKQSWSGDNWKIGNEFIKPGNTTTYTSAYPSVLIDKTITKASDTVAIPEYTEIPLPKGADLVTVVAALQQHTPKDRPAASTAQEGIQHIPVLASDKDKCAPISSRAKSELYPVNTFEVMRVLGLNRTVKSDVEKGLPITVGDTGLFLSPTRRFFTDDMVRDRGTMSPDTNYLRRQHGTYVATAALGGPSFLKLWPLFSSPIQVEPRNIISKVQGCRSVKTGKPPESGEQSDYCEIDDKGMSDLVAKGRTGAIVNLSVEHLGVIERLKYELSSSGGKFLLVAAAGNSASEIPDDSYPAKLADFDEFKSFVMVVASLEENGEKLSGHSSYHSHWVEIAAPGCRVPVYEYNETPSLPTFRLVRQSGTSLAAPLVSFTAALLSKQTEIVPAVIKKRIIASADYVPALNGLVRNNARLNIARALAVFHDVVQLKDGRVVYGKLDGDDFSLPLCGGKTPKRRSELRSLSVYDAGDIATVFFYYGSSGDQTRPEIALKSARCALSEVNTYSGEDLAQRKLKILDDETGADVEFRLADVANITLAHEPYWKQ